MDTGVPPATGTELGTPPRGVAQGRGGTVGALPPRCHPGAVPAPRDPPSPCPRGGTAASRGAGAVPTEGRVSAATAGPRGDIGEGTPALPGALPGARLWHALSPVSPALARPRVPCGNAGQAARTQPGGPGVPQSHCVTTGVAQPRVTVTTGGHSRGAWAVTVSPRGPWRPSPLQGRPKTPPALGPPRCGHSQGQAQAAPGSGGGDTPVPNTG